MRFRLLGKLRVSADDVDLTPSGPKERQVLALLLLSANEIVQKEQVAQELWGDHRPASASTTVHTYIYHLRRQFGSLRRDEGLHMLLTRQSGYSMVVGEDDLDVEPFRRHVTSGVEAAREGHWEEASARLRQAAALWTGPALSDVDVGPLLDVRLAELREVHMKAVEFRVIAEMNLGWHRELIEELRTLVGAHPFHETLNAQLVIALARSGRRDEALAVHTALVRRLRDELGLEPSWALRRLRGDLTSEGADLVPVLRTEPALAPVNGDRSRAAAGGPRTLGTF